MVVGLYFFSSKYKSRVFIQNTIIMNKIFALCLFCFLNVSNVFAHGDLHERIQKVTKQIKVYPDSAYLYVKRGKLYYQHESYKKSIDDLKKSNELGYTSIEQGLLFAKAYMQLDHYSKALKYTDAILLVSPQNVRAYKLKGDIYFIQKEFEESAKCFQEVINNAAQVMPENYIDIALAWEATSSEIGYNKAQVVLMEGINRLGQLISLYNQLLELYITHNDYQNAINLQLQIIDFSQRKEFGYFKLSELYKLSKNKQQAIKYIQMAKDAYNQLPDRIKSIEKSKEFIQDVTVAENKLKTN